MLPISKKDVPSYLELYKIKKSPDEDLHNCAMDFVTEFEEYSYPVLLVLEMAKTYHTYPCKKTENDLRDSMRWALFILDKIIEE